MTSGVRWVRDPHHGGRPIPETLRHGTAQRIRAYADQHYAGSFREIDIRFRAQFCYVDALLEPGDTADDRPLPRARESHEEAVERPAITPLHLCRLRHFDREQWGLALYSYAGERYEPSFFATGEPFGTPEEAFELAASLYFG